MSEKNLMIRLETKEDYRKIENLTREAFWNVYRPGCMEHFVLHCYRNDPAFVSELDFVMELDGELIGQIIYKTTGKPAITGALDTYFQLSREAKIALSRYYKGTIYWIGSSRVYSLPNRKNGTRKSRIIRPLHP